MTSPDIPHSVVTSHILIFMSGYEHSPMLETTRTYRAKIVNHSQVSDDLDDCGHSASKLWNVARYHSQQEWERVRFRRRPRGRMKRPRTRQYKDLHSQSSSFETAPPSRDANELRSVGTARSRRIRCVQQLVQKVQQR